VMSLISPPSNESGSANDNVGGPLADKLLVLHELPYQRFRGMREIRTVLGGSPDMDDVLVILKEYEQLIEVLMARTDTDPRTQGSVRTNAGFSLKQC